MKVGDRDTPVTPIDAEREYGHPAKQERGFHLWLMTTTSIRLIETIDDYCNVTHHETEHSDAL